MLELILDEWKQEPDPVFKNPIFRIRIWPKMDLIRKPASLRKNGEKEQNVCKKWTQNWSKT